MLGLSRSPPKDCSSLTSGISLYCLLCLPLSSLLSLCLLASPSVPSCICTFWLPRWCLRVSRSALHHRSSIPCVFCPSVFPLSLSGDASYLSACVCSWGCVICLSVSLSLTAASHAASSVCGAFAPGGSQSRQTTQSLRSFPRAYTCPTYGTGWDEDAHQVQQQAQHQQRAAADVAGYLGYASFVNEATKNPFRGPPQVQTLQAIGRH